MSAVLTSGSGIEEIRPAAVLLATGCRERPRAARLVPGDRPSGVLTTGELQQRVYLGGERLEGRALIVGAEHVSFSAAVTLAHAGARVLALVTDQRRHQSYAAFKLGAALRWRVPVWTSTAVTRVTGADGRLAAVDVVGVNGRTSVSGTVGADGGAAQARTVECEWLVFTGDWIPDHALARTAGLTLDPGTRGPAIDTTMATSAPGVFAAGNLIHAAETADVAALSGRHAARQIAAYLVRVPAQAQSSAQPQSQALAQAQPQPQPHSQALAQVQAQAWSQPPVPVLAESPLRWISPNAIATAPDAGPVLPPLGRFAIRSAEYRDRATLEARQDGRLLARSRPLRLIPGRPVHLRASWVTSVHLAGGPVRVGVAAPG